MFRVVGSESVSVCAEERQVSGVNRADARPPALSCTARWRRCARLNFGKSDSDGAAAARPLEHRTVVSQRERVSPPVNDSPRAIRATVLAALRIGDAGLPDNPVVRSIALP